MKAINRDETVHGEEYVLLSEAEAEIAAAVARERERSDRLISALQLIADQDPAGNIIDPQWVSELAQGAIDAAAIRG